MREATAAFMVYGGLGGLLLLIAYFLCIPSIGERYVSAKDWIQRPRNLWGTICLILGLLLTFIGAIPLLSF